ncbi:SDR family NAD(P)-dependent oxidoreductase [Kytococcus sp. Marseille-QA3725]
MPVCAARHRGAVAAAWPALLAQVVGDDRIGEAMAWHQGLRVVATPSGALLGSALLDSSGVLPVVEVLLARQELGATATEYGWGEAASRGRRSGPGAPSWSPASSRAWSWRAVPCAWWRGAGRGGDRRPGPDRVSSMETTPAPGSHPMALVTGASSGIGKEFAHQLAAKGHGLVLVARDRARLEALAVHLGTHFGVPTEVLVADLSQRQQMELVVRRLQQQEDPVELLVNNAGYGLGTAFLESEIEDEEDALAVMVRAVMVLSQAAVQSMRERGHGAVVNVSSIASWLPYGTYGAAKAWVRSFTEGLAHELRDTDVHVQALLPGLTHTEFHDRMGEHFAAFPDRLWLRPEQVVRESLAAIGSGEVHCVPGLAYKAAALVLPRLPHRLVAALSARFDEHERDQRSSRRVVSSTGEAVAVGRPAAPGSGPANSVPSDA